MTQKYWQPWSTIVLYTRVCFCVCVCPVKPCTWAVNEKSLVVYWNIKPSSHLTTYTHTTHSDTLWFYFRVSEYRKNPNTHTHTHNFRQGVFCFGPWLRVCWKSLLSYQDDLLTLSCAMWLHKAAHTRYLNRQKPSELWVYVRSSVSLLTFSASGGLPYFWGQKKPPIMSINKLSCAVNSI